MSIVNELDRAIKLFEKKTTEGAHVVPYNDGQLYKMTYVTNEEWNDFLESMSETTRKRIFRQRLVARRILMAFVKMTADMFLLKQNAMNPIP